MSTKLVFASLFAAAMTAPMFGCPGELDDEARFRTDGGTTPAACTDAPGVVFMPLCATSGCHNKVDSPSSGGLDLETPDIIGRTKNAPSKGSMMVLLIDSANPEKSSIYSKLKSPPPFGARMPLGAAQIPADKIECVLNWIKKESAGSGPADTGTTPMDTGTKTDAADAGG